MNSRPDLFKQHPLSGLLEILDMGEGEPQQCGFLAGFLFFFPLWPVPLPEPAGPRPPRRELEKEETRADLRVAVFEAFWGHPQARGTRGGISRGYLWLHSLGFSGLSSFSTAKPTVSAGWTPDFSRSLGIWGGQPWLGTCVVLPL